MGRVNAAAPVAAVAAASGGAADAQKSAEKDSFDVGLTEVGDKKN